MAAWCMSLQETQKDMSTELSEENKAAKALLEIILAAMPADIRSSYIIINPNYPRYLKSKHNEYPDVRLENFQSNSYNVDAYWRLLVGKYGDQRRFKLRAGLDDTRRRMVAKVIETVVELASTADVLIQQRLEKDAQLKRSEAWLKVKPNMKLAEVVTDSTYVRSYDVDVHEDGTITMEGKTRTQEQWQKVMDLKLKQAADMKALLSSFGNEI